MRLCFVRHGESEANVLKVISNRGLIHPLTDLGREQAAQLARSLADVHFARIYASPLLRARQTAEIVSAALSVPVEFADALREPDCGIAEGRSDEAAWAERNRISAAWLIAHDYEACLEGGESFNEVRARFTPFLDRVLVEYAHTDDSILVITHRLLIYTMMSITLTNAAVALAEWQPIPNTGTIIVERQAAGWVCVEWCGTPIGM
jgi:probable phosphoglycerate mutase